MASKLAKSTLPVGHTQNDFRAFGPVATQDCNFADCRMAELGCFKQEVVDSNKYYVIAVVQSTITNKYYAYFEWGRTRPDGRPDKPSFQFTECSSEQEAASICREQFDEKNTKRGVWETVGSKKRFVSKPNKDAYIVRPTASRLVGLPCCENITNEDAKGLVSQITVSAATNGIKKSSKKIDIHTRKLFQDLLGGAVKYAKTVMSGGSGGSGKVSLPTQGALTDAKDILDDALACIGKIGNDLNIQLANNDLKKLTYSLYSLVPKAKPLGAPESSWLLTQANIALWKLDLDAFETALQANTINIEEDSTDIMQGIPADVEWIDPSSVLGKWLTEWWGSTKGHKHSHGPLKIHNLWRVNRHGDEALFMQNVANINKEMPKLWNNERPMFIHNQKERPDISSSTLKTFWDTNVALLYHASRTINIPGIIRENFRFATELKNSGVVINASMFGAGATYVADAWTKSSNYCSSPTSIYAGNSGGVTGRKAFMFACDSILGVPYVAPEAYGFASPPHGKHCVMGKAGYTKGWNGPLLNNEFVFYSKNKILIRYLAEISW